MAEIGSDIFKAAKLLASGEVIAIPTETVYGLGAIAFDLVAVSRVFEIKQRPFFDPLILHFANKKSAFAFFKSAPADFEKLANYFWPGPLTLVAEKNEEVPDIITAGSSLVAVRVPNHPLTLELLEIIDAPLAAPSANPFGYVSPTNPEHVQDNLGDLIPYILDGGPCKLGIESTILGYKEGKIQLWRLGAIDKSAIENVLGYQIEELIAQNSKPDAPGQLDKHYSPLTPIFLTTQMEMESKIANATSNEFSDVAVLFFGDLPDTVVAATSFQFNLSENRDLFEAAHKLYAGLRQLDRGGYKEIWAVLLPDFGVGKAINDRLKRASVKE